MTDAITHSTFSVKLPYTVSFSFPDDDHLTQITIQTTSQVLRYGRDEQDIQSQMKLDQEHAQSTYAKHIIKWVGERLWDTDVKETTVTFGDNPTVEIMTDEEIDAFREDCLNDD